MFIWFVHDGWLVGRLTSPFNAEIGYIKNKVLHGDLVPPGKRRKTIL